MLKKFLNFFARRKGLVAFLVIILIIVTVFQFIAFSCVNVCSLTLDRWQMGRVNRIEVETRYGTTVIQDRRLIADIVSATVVATDWVQCHGSFGWYGNPLFRLYRNDTLVREMELEIKHYQMRVYFPGRPHFFFTNSDSMQHQFDRYGGVVPLRRDLVGRIQQYLQADGNRLHR